MDPAGSSPPAIVGPSDKDLPPIESQTSLADRVFSPVVDVPSSTSADAARTAQSLDESEEEQLPDIVVPDLVAPTMFLPIPNTDPLTTLLTKHIFPPEARPIRDVTGEWQQTDFHTLVMANSWRALARMARDRIVVSDAADLHLVLGFWYLRLSSLSRLRLFNQTAAECTNLFNILNAIEPPEDRQFVFERVLPFELEVMQARLHYWAGDAMSYLDALSELLRTCKLNARFCGKRSDEPAVAMWRERGSRLSLIIASQMVEMKDFVAAARHIEPLCAHDGLSSPAVRSAVGRIYLQGGYISKAAKHFSIVAADPSASARLKTMNDTLLACALADWSTASDNLRRLLEEDAENHVAVNNLAVALLSQGKLKEGIQVLESALTSSPTSVVVTEPFLFNLSTLYELRSAIAAPKKRELLIQVAKYSGDGLRTTCLKMPAN